MPPTKTRKSDKRAEFQPEFTPVDEETPLGFFEKFYAPHENPKWQQLAALGLAQIIIDADRRRAEFQKQKAAKPPLPEEKVQASRRGPGRKERPGPPFNREGGNKSPRDCASRSSLPSEPPEFFADAPHGKSAAGGLDVLRKNSYADEAVSRRAAARRTTVNGDASKGDPGLKPSAHGSAASADGAADAESLGGKSENIGAAKGLPINSKDASGLQVRQLSDNETSLVNKAIDLIDEYGYSNEAARLRNMLDKDQIKVDPNAREKQGASGYSSISGWNDGDIYLDDNPLHDDYVGLMLAPVLGHELAHIVQDTNYIFPWDRLLLHRAGEKLGLFDPEKVPKMAYDLLVNKYREKHKKKLQNNQ